MNIFVLHERDHKKCVEQYPDKHVVKMITESVQMLSTNLRLHGIEEGYKPTHPNHPCTVWARSSLSNWMWLCDLVVAMHEEYQFRYEKKKRKIHKAFEVFLSLPNLPIPDHGLTPFVQCMDERFRGPNAVDAYRTFYVYDKPQLRLNYKEGKRETPWWYYDCTEKIPQAV